MSLGFDENKAREVSQEFKNEEHTSHRRRWLRLSCGRLRPPRIVVSISMVV
jgi:hypothetical protein